MGLRLLKNAVVTIKFQKCAFSTTKLDQLGPLMWPDGFQVNNYTVEAIRKLKTPTNITDLRSFPGPCSVIER